MNIEKQYLCHGGTLTYYVHDSRETQTPMRFTLFMPSVETGTNEKIPYIVFLSGLTCTAENFTTKANAYKRAAAMGIAVLVPDTSPRGDEVADSSDYDLGQGAGFYVDATEAPWVKHFRMESYVVAELLPMVEALHNLDVKRCSIMGHSMGGHGALTLYLRHKGRFASCSAFSPIVAPTQVPWGHKAFTSYFGTDQSTWSAHDATYLVGKDTHAAKNAPILIDQGGADTFLIEQLKPQLFEAACHAAGQKLTLRIQDGYDHSYFFIQSFIDDHLAWHAAQWGA
jgi:S-formylglutathione hydrolase